MRQSQVSPSFTVDKDVWVISVLNAGSPFGGHAILVVEGEQIDGRIFVGQYDIRADIPPARGTFNANPTGYISEIGIREGVAYTYPGGYQRLSHRSFHMDARKFPALREAIVNDKEITDRAKSGAGEYLPYQFVGSQGMLYQLLGADNNGINCAEWCIGKLKIAGCDAGKMAEKKPVPEKSAMSMSRMAAYLGSAALAVYDLFQVRR